jgi:hypothetical protein
METQLLLLFSHDANILYLRRLLDLSWVSEGYSEGIADPGGVLLFELWKSENSYFVKVCLCLSPSSADRLRSIMIFQLLVNKDMQRN